jgi:hypothetical protein
MDTLLWGSLYSCTSFFFFTSLSTFIDSWCTPAHLRVSAKKTWKWVNYAVSWVHSTMSGCLGILAICLAPNILDNIITGYSELGMHCATSLIVGSGRKSLVYSNSSCISYLFSLTSSKLVV